MKLTTTTHVSVDGLMADSSNPIAAALNTRRRVSIQVYRPIGRPQYATATAD